MDDLKIKEHDFPKVLRSMTPRYQSKEWTKESTLVQKSDLSRDHNPRNLRSKFIKCPPLRRFEQLLNEVL